MSLLGGRAEPCGGRASALHDALSVEVGASEEELCFRPVRRRLLEHLGGGGGITLLSHETFGVDSRELELGVRLSLLGGLLQ